jgi:hypothetical protein
MVPLAVLVFIILLMLTIYPRNGATRPERPSEIDYQIVARERSVSPAIVVENL